MYDISEVTTKIKKLLALADLAATEAEAVAAAARAQELINKYNLSIGTEALEEEEGDREGLRRKHRPDVTASNHLGTGCLPAI